MIRKDIVHKSYVGDGPELKNIYIYIYISEIEAIHTCAPDFIKFLLCILFGLHIVCVHYLIYSQKLRMLHMKKIKF